MCVVTFSKNKSLTLDDYIKTGHIPIYAIMGDSWCYNDRMISYHRVGTSHLVMRPHKVQVGIETTLGYPTKGTISFGWFESYSFPSLTYRAALANERMIERWAHDVPRVTILHMGACFIAGSYDLDIWHDEQGRKKSMKTIYRQEVTNFLTQWKILTAAACKSPASIAQYNTRMQRHTFILVNVPDWCKQKIRGITAEEYRKLRKDANQGITRMEEELWQDYNTIICRPQMSGVEWDASSVHPSIRDQEIWAEQVLQVNLYIYIIFFCVTSI